MNKNLTQMLKVSEGRYLSDTEKTLFQNYYQNLPQRLAHAQAVEAAEAQIIKATLDIFYEKYPDMLNISASREKSERDMAYLLRTVTTAMVQNEYANLIPKVKFIFDIFARLNFTPGAIDFAYITLREQVRTQIAAETHEAMEPFLNVLHARRLISWQEIQDKAPQLIQALTQKVFEDHPEVKNMNSPEENLRRDMRALLDACSQAMVSQNDAPVDELKQWLYAFFKGLAFDMDTVFKTYADAPETLAPHLSSDTLTRIKPYLKRLAEQ